MPLKEINVRFQRDPLLDSIDVLISAAERDAAVTRLMEKITGEPPEALSVQTADGELVSIYTDDIISVSVIDKLTLLQTETGSFTLRQSLQSIENLLNPDTFLRISRHEIINVDKIEKCDLSIKNELRLRLSGGLETWASHRSIPAVLNRLRKKRRDDNAE